jgi:hypothetical protein
MPVKTSLLSRYLPTLKSTLNTSMQGTTENILLPQANFLHSSINSRFGGEKHVSSENIQMFPPLFHTDSKKDYKEVIP